MSAPPLPETFGNYALGDFVEVAAPPAISWLPQTAGWLWLGLVLLAILGRYGWKWLRHWYRNRYRREAATRLQALSAVTGQKHRVAEFNRLLKLTALAAFPREQVARLSGPGWVSFLNGQCATPPFSEEQRHLLEVSTYTDHTVDPSTARQLAAACLAWIQEHEVVEPEVAQGA